MTPGALKKYLMVFMLVFMFFIGSSLPIASGSHANSIGGGSCSGCTAGSGTYGSSLHDTVSLTDPNSRERGTGEYGKFVSNNDYSQRTHHKRSVGPLSNPDLESDDSIDPIAVSSKIEDQNVKKAMADFYDLVTKADVYDDENYKKLFAEFDRHAELLDFGSDNDFSFIKKNDIQFENLADCKANIYNVADRLNIQLKSPIYIGRQFRNFADYQAEDDDMLSEMNYWERLMFLLRKAVWCKTKLKPYSRSYKMNMTVIEKLIDEYSSIMGLDDITRNRFYKSLKRLASPNSIDESPKTHAPLPVSVDY